MIDRNGNHGSEGHTNSTMTEVDEINPYGTSDQSSRYVTAEQISPYGTSDDIRSAPAIAKATATGQGMNAYFVEKLLQFGLKM